MCPTDSSTIRRLPSLHGVPSGWVPPLPRYCEDATTSRCPSRLASFPSLGDTIYGLRPSLFAPSGLQDASAHGPGTSLAVTPLPLHRHGGNETSQVPGRPSFASASFSDPDGISASGHPTLQYGPRQCNCEDSRLMSSRGSIARLLRSLSTLHGHGRPWSCKTRFRLLARLYRVGLTFQQGRDERFQPMRILLSQASLGAIHFDHF